MNMLFLLLFACSLQMEELDASDTLETSCQTQVCGKPGFSTPSSPSCASAAAKAESGAFAMPVPVAVVLLPGSHVPAALVAVPSGCLPSVRLPGMLPLEEVHPPSTGAQGSASSKPASAQRAAEEGPNAACTEQTLLRRSSSSGSSANQAVEAVAPAAAPAAAAEVAAADTDASPSAAPVASSPRAGAAPAVKAAAAPKAASPKVTAAKPAEAVAEPKLPPPMQRVPRIKHKPRRADDPPRPLLEPSSNNSSSCSPNKVKKRPAGRMAIAPTSGHSCTQCGAVVSARAWAVQDCGCRCDCLPGDVTSECRVCAGDRLPGDFVGEGRLQSFAPCTHGNQLGMSLQIYALAVAADMHTVLLTHARAASQSLALLVLPASVCSQRLCGALDRQGPRRCAMRAACAT